MIRYRKQIIGLFVVLAVLSGFSIFNLRFSFDFEQFFPTGDKDLEFFRDFIKDFETDDNYMLIAVKRDSGVFNQPFLEQFHDLSLRTRQLPYVVESQSLTMFSYPIKMPFGITTIPAIHIDDVSRYASDSARLLNDERFVQSLISKDAKTLVIFMKTINSIQLDQAREHMQALNDLMSEYDFEQYHYLGRPYFQTELVDMQIREITVSALVSAILVAFILFWIFRRPIGVFIAITSIGLGMLLFLGLLAALGRELNAMSALYPVLMIIVGTSDVVHIMSKYIDELQRGKEKKAAIWITIKEIGLATLLTSITTAIGFSSLIASRILPIREFGFNAALGVMVAYITVILFTTAALSFFRADQLIKFGKGHAFWQNAMNSTYHFTLNNKRSIIWGTFITLVIFAVGISRINTNYNIIGNMPIGKKITEDFKFFEAQLTGFRPMEFAIYAQGDHEADDFAVLQQIDSLENHLRKIPAIQGVTSITAIYKSINQMMNNNRQEAYRLPESETQFERYHKFANQTPKMGVNILMSKDHKKARISTRVQDLGADTLKQLGVNLDHWITENIDSNIVSVRRTGTGLIIDKNAEYVRESLLKGLGMAILIVSLLMALLFRNMYMLIIALIPNMIPLILAGALLGFLGIELEAGVAIVFAIVFGIAVDDTIHFLSKFKLARSQGLDLEEAIHTTFLETGKAICLTTIILFFGFLVMLFSIHPPSVTIGLLISATLISALISDLLLIPILMRWLLK
ncbi:MAG: transporter [Saprospiraceae bacterium]|nr:MAG: transporter [Saprospiraceae bacterium]